MGDREAPEVVVAGGGSAGLCLGLALKRFLPDLAVEVIDARPSGAASSDERSSAIAAAARRMLERLGVWDVLADDAQPILSMEVTDSRTGDATRPVFLTFDGNVAEGEPFAHMVGNAPLLEALRAEAEAAGVKTTWSDGVAGFSPEPGAVRIDLSSGKRRSARLLVAADGVRSRLRSLAGIKTVEWSYPQMALVCTVGHERPHHGVAVEHFLPAGPFAILPLKGNRSSLVWTERKEDAERLLNGDEFVFLVELERRFGHRLGRIELESRRQGYPLGLILARDFVKPRLALLGDAAHGIHPIAGQGLNLGFRDVAALAETLVDAARLGLDIGGIDVLRRYERWRRYDTWQMGVTTDILNRLFSNDIMPVRAFRDFGLGLVDRMPQLKRMFIGEAAGLGGDLPKLLAGHAI
ncbi:ubiquinone biosynthesis hydroxylase [Propylenella binzhouense]|uniref:Ubiquinone biosynthesis hydroxylase n=1 Tax=Propylenella binzhouense TaxID=2555902 RepID=A0A964T3T2_9HYPH|nr:ubiquinone biosynthesis hydroxylase [Propylenella binzhouense]MYZ47865.1 ubiquinone biosynthesis hydroxylase [Propylenella binzhouense]